MSPYENRLIAEDFRRIALVASIHPESIDALPALLSKKPDTLLAELSAAGINQLQMYVRKLEGRSFLFVYFETQVLDQEAAAQQLKNSSAWWRKVEAHLIQHPRALEKDLPWQRAEFINVIASNTDSGREIGQAMGLLSAVHLESELWYRTLHQTNWPGVIDQMRRSHYQNWTTFLLEWEDELFLFTHVEYLGSDQSADDALMAADPVTQRWWKHTEPCLYSVVGEDSSWASMDRY
ncbi:MAG: L-rhamnose mutarotase [Coraliomargaritaceae bacterium]